MKYERERGFRMARICKIYSFAAAHHLPNASQWGKHKCSALHGHNYKIEVEARGEANINPGQPGWVCDFAWLDRAMAPILEALDHSNLNAIDGLENPTAEIIAFWVLDRLLGPDHPPPVWRVRVWETDKCWAEAVNEDGAWPRFHRS